MAFGAPAPAFRELTLDRPTYQRVRELFHAAADLAPAAREALLDDACAGAPELRREVELLFALERAGLGAALDRPPAAAAALRAEVAPAADVPRTIGRYRLLELLGEGGFGTVFLAEQTEPVVRRVALKVIKPGMDTRQVIARFEAERQALALMDHPHIARVLDAGSTESGRPYFVMERVDGVPITRYCDRERLTVRQRLELFLEVCGAVQHAHQKGVIHRDLKPSNVLVAEADGRPAPKVIDFGIAKATATRLTEATLHTGAGQLLGTPQSMSPEQADPSGVDVDTRSDVYSLGVLLYELLAGSTPLDGRELGTASLAEIQRRIREEEPERPSQRAGGPEAAAVAAARATDVTHLARQLRGDLDWIALKCLEKDRERRYPTAAALAEDIGRHLEELPVLARPPSRPDRIRKFVRRNRAAVAAAALVLLVLAVAAGVSSFYAVRESRQRRAAEQAQLRAERAEREASARAAELEQVARFQAAQLAGVDPDAMGERLRAGLLARVHAAAERDAGPEAAAASTAELEQRIAGGDFTGLALDALQHGVFAPALAAIGAEFAERPLLQARLLQTLADTERTLGLLDAAREPQERALAIRQRELGPEHADTVASLIASGLLFQAQGRLQEAEPLLREAVATGERALSSEHPTTLEAKNARGLQLRLAGDFAGAEDLYREALRVQRRVLGESHPDTLTTLSNLGTLLTAADRLPEAAACFREALARFRALRGEEHPETLLALGNLAGLLLSEGKTEEAEPIEREVLEKRRRVLGDAHPDTLMSINNLGYLLHITGRLAEAEPLYREALELRRKVLGPEHPKTLNSLNNLGGLLKEAGKLGEAEACYRAALSGRRRALGPDHPETIGSIRNLGWLLDAQGKWDEAEAVDREAIAKYRAVLGDEHRDTLGAIGNLSHLLLARGKAAETAALLAPALPAMRRAFSGGQPVLLARYLVLLARARTTTGEFAAAEADLLEAIEILATAKGAPPDYRTQALQLLAELDEAWQQAEPNAERAAQAAARRERLAAKAAGP